MDLYFDILRQDDKMSEAKKNPEKTNKGGKVGTVIGVILCVLLIPILIVNGTIIIKGYANKDKVPTFLGYAPLIVLSPSMDPAIQEGDLVIVKSVDASEIKVNDVISFFDPDSREGSVLTHRVTAVNRTETGTVSFTTKGDANLSEDLSAAPAESLIGVYRFRIPKAGRIAMFLQTTPGYIVSVALPLILLIAYELIRRRKYDKAKDDDTKALLAELEALRAKQAAAQPESADPPPAEPNE